MTRYGPFVVNTRSEIVQAVEGFNSGRLIRETPGHLNEVLPHRSDADT